jgi:hypothetical protein
MTFCGSQRLPSNPLFVSTRPTAPIDYPLDLTHRRREFPSIIHRASSFIAISFAFLGPCFEITSER